MFLNELHFKQFIAIISFYFNCKITNGLVWPQSSSFAYVAALALPLDLPNKDVYFAFNFAANYGLPSSKTHNELIEKWNLDQPQDTLPNSFIPINGASRNYNKVYTRKNFFNVFTNHLTTFSLNGTACLLRTICEVSKTPLDENNGVLGSIFKIVFLPSTSNMERKISKDYYNAELNGKHGNCDQYNFNCPIGLLDLVSTFLNY